MTLDALPAIGLKLTALAEALQNGYSLTTKGKFQEAIAAMRSILLSVPLLVLDSRNDQTEAEQVMSVFRVSFSIDWSC